MPRIETSIFIKKPRKEVFEFLKAIEKFPSILRDVRDIRILQRFPNRTISLWRIEVDGAPLSWRQENIFNEARFRIDFHMLDGDYARYEGHWQIQSHPLGCRVRILADFDWGIPILERHVGRTLQRKAKLAFQGMLKAIKKKLEGK